MAARLLRAFSFMATKERPNQDQIKRQVVDFELKAATDAEGFAGEFEGYAAGIHNVDSVGDMILPGAFAEDLPRFLREGAVCWNHDWMLPIGKPVSAKEDNYGLFVKAQISKTSTGNDIMTLIRDGVVKKMSIGYRVKDYQYVDRAGLVSYLGANCTREKSAAILQQYDEMELTELFLIRKLKLYEFSPVTFPANNNASIVSAKSDPLTGLTFADHSKAVLTTVSEYAKRAAAIAALKQQQNRKTIFNDERTADISEVIQNLSQSLESLKSVLETPRATTDEDAARLFAEFQKLEARLNGCAV